MRSPAHDADAVAEEIGLAHRVRRQDHGAALHRDLDEVPEIPLRSWIQARRRFVQQHHRGPPTSATATASLRFMPRQAARRFVGVVGQADDGACSAASRACKRLRWPAKSTSVRDNSSLSLHGDGAAVVARSSGEEPASAIVAAERDGVEDDAVTARTRCKI